MTVRRALFVLAAVALVVPATAHAAPSARAKTVCNLLPDRGGDGGLNALKYGPIPQLNSPPMDIVSADIATGSKTIVGNIKVASLDLLDPQAFPEVTYSFYFTVKNTEYTFTIVRHYLGTVEYSFSAGSATGSINQATKTISFATARSNVKPLATKGQKLTELRARTTASGTAKQNADNTEVDRKVYYLDRTPSCLKPA